MADCQLRIEWPGQARFIGGDKASGKVQVFVNEPVPRCELWIELAWRTSGKGNRDGEQVSRKRVFTGALEKGPSSFAFEVALPKGPYSYSGELLSLDWLVTARLSLPSEIDPWSESIFHLAAAKKGPHVGTQVRTGARPDGVSIQGQANSLRLGLGAAAILIALLLVATTVQNGLTGPTVAIFGLCLAIGLGLLIGPIRRKLAEKNLGRVSVKMGDGPGIVGRALPCEVAFSPTGSLEVLDIELCLRCEEVVSRGYDNERRTITKGVFESVESLPGVPTRLNAGPQSFQHSIMIPRDVPLSFRSKENEVLWTLSVLVDVEAGVSWENTYSICVMPKG